MYHITTFVLSKNKKKYHSFHLKITIFTAVKKKQKRVCVMCVCLAEAKNLSNQHIDSNTGLMPTEKKC